MIRVSGAAADGALFDSMGTAEALIRTVAGPVPIGSIEALQCLRDPEGIRLGDTWAQTQVIDGKVQADQPQRSNTREQEARAPVRLRKHVSGLHREGES